MTQIKINETLYPTILIEGRMQDYEWDNRESKAITLNMAYDEAITLFGDNINWSIVDENDELIRNEWDNSNFCVLGDIIIHRDGSITVKMGKMTELEEAYELMFGGKE